MKIIVDTKACYGCKTCELACSFHHIGAFQPTRASIKIHSDHVKGNINWSVDSTCDECIDEELPLCIKFCTYGAIKIEEI